jgi:hypothetical protein
MPIYLLIFASLAWIRLTWPLDPNKLAAPPSISTAEGLEVKQRESGCRNIRDALRESHCFSGVFWSHPSDSNRRPADYEPDLRTNLNKLD